MDTGYIKLFRCIQWNELWEQRPFSRGQAWIDLILIANHRDGSKRVRGIKVDIKRGQVGWSARSLGERWGWSITKVMRFLAELENDQQIVTQKSKLTTLIYIVNYEKYQGESDTESDTEVKQKEHRSDKNKNVKNIKKESKPIAQSENPSEPAIIEIILNNKSLHPVTQSDIDDWCVLFPAVDVLQELRKMAAWADANQTRRKTDKGIRRFIVAWLSKEQDRGRVQPVASSPTDADRSEFLRRRAATLGTAEVANGR